MKVHREMGRHRSADPSRRRRRGHRKPLRRPLRRGPRRFDGARRGARRPLGRPRGRSASGYRPRRSRVTARRPWSAPTVRWNMPRHSHPKLGAPLRAAVENGRGAWCRRRRSAAHPARPSTFRSVTRMRPMFAAISTAWKFGSTMRRGRMKSWSAVAITDSGRPLPRVGGLEAKDTVGEGRSSISLNGRRRPTRLREF